MRPGQRLDRRQWAGLLAMIAGMFIAILDIQIVAASLSDIQAGLSASPDEASWIQTSYLIAEVVMIPLSSWLSRLLSTRMLFAASALGFTLFSLACAGASTIEQMILFRAGQGFFGGAMIPTVFATIFLVFTGAQQARMSMLIGYRRDHGAHDRPGPRRLADRQLFLALAVPDQRSRGTDNRSNRVDER